jgi:hypothetical protein
MDPISKAVESFRVAVREQLRAPGVRIIRVTASPDDGPMVARAIRAEEWHEENHAPYLIFDQAHETDIETLAEMCSQVKQHYGRLRDAFADGDQPLPAFAGPAFSPADPVASFAQHVQAFAAGTAGVLETPLLVWIPTNMKEVRAWVATALGIVRHLWATDMRFVLRDDGTGELHRALEPAAAVAVTVPFAVDQRAVLEFFRKLSMPASPGRAAGTMPGSAAPDVLPPERPGPKPATGPELRAILEKEGLPPALAADEGEQLRHLLLAAAEAAGRQDERGAITAQAAAAELCMNAGVRIEQALMILLLGVYCLQFGREADAEIAWRRAEQVAGEAGAYPQLAQVRLALAHLHFRNQKDEDAAALYEQAAFAARMGEAELLWLEALRMAGTCHVRRGVENDAYYCWTAAVRKAPKLSGDEIRNSTFMDVASDLLELLRRHGMEQQAHSVVALIQEAGAKAGAEPAA